MALVEHAERELKAAGLLGKEGPYDGFVAEAALDLVKLFAAQGHSGGSAPMTVMLFKKLAAYETLTPLEDPSKTGEYMRVEEGIAGKVGTLQSTRRHSVFSADNGKTWYDIDKKVPRWKRWFGVQRVYLKFT